MRYQISTGREIVKRKFGTAAGDLSTKRGGLGRKAAHFSRSFEDKTGTREAGFGFLQFGDIERQEFDRATCSGNAGSVVSTARPGNPGAESCLDVYEKQKLISVTFSR